MRAVIVRDFGGPDVLRVEDVPAPAPGPGEVLVAVRAAGVNPVEAYTRTGHYDLKPDLPYTPGSDAAGVVEAVGRGFSTLRPGDRVFVCVTRTGAYAEKTVCVADRVFPLPEGLTFEQGAALGVPYAAAHRALFHCAGLREGETVLVHGASGGVGSAAVQLALSAGATVIGTGGGPEGAAFVRGLGAQHALDHNAPGYQAEISALTGGRGPELIIEMLANVNLPADLALVATRGQIVIVGSRGTVSIDPRDTMKKDVTVRGMTLRNMPPAERGLLYADLCRRLASGALRPVVGRTFPLEEAAKAHKAVMAPGARGKIVLLP